jgi:hypothetical protein
MLLAVFGSSHASPVDKSSAPEIKIEEALELIQGIMKKEKIDQLHSIDSLVYFDQNNLGAWTVIGPHWKARYKTEYSHLEPDLLLPRHHYILVSAERMVHLVSEPGNPIKQSKTDRSSQSTQCR